IDLLEEVVAEHHGIVARLRALHYQLSPVLQGAAADAQFLDRICVNRVAAAEERVKAAGLPAHQPEAVGRRSGDAAHVRSSVERYADAIAVDGTFDHQDLAARIDRPIGGLHEL